MMETGGENLREQNIRLLKDNYECLQKNITLLNSNNALNNDKIDLLKENKELKEQIETELDKLNKEIEKIKKTNDALKVLLQELQDENSYYKNCDFIDKTFDNHLVKSIFIIPYMYFFSFRKIRLFESLLINIFTFLFFYFLINIFFNKEIFIFIK
jgi:hypothetical protein